MTAPSFLERVRKLLAKAEDPGVTAKEAEAYNAKAAELIDARLNAYQIDTEDGRSISGIAFKAMGLKPVGRVGAEK